MSTIGILDDRPDEADTTKSIISRNLHDANWGVVSVPLLPTTGRIVEWLTDQSINVLVVDQKLNDNPSTPVNYSGHDVIQEVRRGLPDLPVYMLTAFSDTPEVVSNLSAMEELVPRGDLGKRAVVLVARMKRAGETFEHRFRTSLNRISQLSQKQATSSLSAAEKKELKSLQITLSLSDRSASRAEILPDLENEVKKLELLRVKAEKLLKKKRK